jgi:hypothetical protein
MKQKFTLMLGVCAMALTAFTSCEQEIINEYPTMPVNGDALTVVGSVESSSRATDAAWEAGDAIGITSSNIATNAKFVTTNGDGVFSASAANLYIPDTKSHTFYAYYPYTSDISNSCKTITVCDSANVTAQKRNDIMVASTSLTSSSKTLQLQFRHAMARLIINVKTSTDDGFEADDVFSTSNCGALSSIYTEASLNIATGTIATTGDKSKFYMTAPTDDTENHVRQYVVFIPAQAGCKFELIYYRGSSKEQVYSVQLNNSSWEAGKSYTYNVTAKREGLDLSSSSTINNWTSSSADVNATLGN